MRYAASSVWLRMNPDADVRRNPLMVQNYDWAVSKN